MNKKDLKASIMEMAIARFNAYPHDFESPGSPEAAVRFAVYEALRNRTEEEQARDLELAVDAPQYYQWYLQAHQIWIADR